MTHYGYSLSYTPSYNESVYPSIGLSDGTYEHDAIISSLDRPYSVALVTHVSVPSLPSNFQTIDALYYSLDQINAFSYTGKWDVLHNCFLPSPEDKQNSKNVQLKGLILKW